MASRQEQARLSRFASAMAMSRAIEAAQRRIRPGDWLTVKEYTGSTTGERRTVSGSVVYKNEHYFTIQTKHYRESFSFINVALGQVEIV